MPGKKVDRTSPIVAPKAILQLGDRLVTNPHYETQKEILLAFVREHFGGEAFLCLLQPLKSQSEAIKSDPFPFDVQSTSASFEFNESPESIWSVSPLLRGEKEIGRLILHRETSLSQAEKDSLIDIGMVAGLAINATLQTMVQDWRQKQLSLVRSVNAKISQITDVVTLTDAISELVQETFDYYYVAVFLIDEATGCLRFKASAGSDESERPDFENPGHPGFALGEHMIGFAAQTGQELIANDVTAEPRYKEVDSLAETKSEVVLPLKIESETLGVFDIQSDTRNAFDENDLLVLRVLADNIAIAIKSTQLLQDVQRQADQISTVSEASRAITSILNTDELLNRIVNLIHERFNFPYVHLYTVDAVQSRIVFKAGSGARTPDFTDAGISFDLHSEKGVIPWVIQHAESRRVNDVAQEPLYLETPFAADAYGSEMTVPLMFGDEVLGVLDIQSDLKNAFSLEDQQLIETLGDNIAIAIRNARLYRSEQWRRQVAESLRDVAGLLAGNTAQSDVLEAILNELHKNLPCDIAAIWLFSPDSPEEAPLEDRELYLEAYQSNEDYPSEGLSGITFIPDSWVKHALTHEQPTLRQADDTIGPIAAHYGMSQDYSAVAAPLHTGDEILGMLTLTHHSPNRFGLESQKIISAFASYAAIAIKNTRLFTISQEQAWVSTILLQVAQATQSQTNIDELVRTIVRLTPMVVGIKGCALFLRERDSEIYSLYAMYGIGKPGEEIDLSQPLPLPNAPLLAEMTLTHETLFVQDPVEDLNLPEDLALQMAEDDLILIPLIARNEILGAFLLANEPDSPLMNDGQKSVSAERLNIIQGIIQQTAIAVENIRLLESRQEEAYMSAVLLQAAQAVVSNAELADTLDSIVHIMPILVGIDSSLIYLWDKSEGVFRVSQASTESSAIEADLIGTTYAPGDFPMLDTVFQNNRPTVYPFVETTLPPEDWDLALPDEGQIDPTPILQTRYPLLMGFPLSAKEEVFGVLLAQDKNFATNRERRFELLWGISQQASLAIQNDRLNKEMLDRQHLEREFQLAREIQQTFLPSQVPPIPGWEMDVRWDTAQQVGGDFYDYFLLPDGRLAFVIADVSNKGLAASLYMTVTRTLIRAAALESDSPAVTLEHVNDLLLMDSQNGLFVTVFYGLLDLQVGELTYSIAGHNPPMVLRYQDHEVVELEKGGIALGALEEIHLDERSLQLNPGDCLVLYTDGVTEAFNLSDQMYGDERMKKILRSSIGDTASQVLEVLEADLKVFRGESPLSDDTTILAIYRSRSLTAENETGLPADDAIEVSAD